MRGCVRFCARKIDLLPSELCERNRRVTKAVAEKQIIIRKKNTLSGSKTDSFGVVLSIKLYFNTKEKLPSFKTRAFYII